MRVTVWTKQCTLVVALTLPVSGCVFGRTSVDPVCGPPFSRAVDEHAEALLDPGVPDNVVVTGERVVGGLDAYCDR